MQQKTKKRTPGKGWRSACLVTFGTRGTWSGPDCILTIYMLSDLEQDPPSPFAARRQGHSETHQATRGSKTRATLRMVRGSTTGTPRSGAQGAATTRTSPSPGRRQRTSSTGSPPPSSGPGVFGARTERAAYMLVRVNAFDNMRFFPRALRFSSSSSARTAQFQARPLNSSCRHVCPQLAFSALDLSQGFPRLQVAFRCSVFQCTAHSICPCFCNRVHGGP